MEIVWSMSAHSLMLQLLKLEALLLPTKTHI